ncbi:AbrB/MazE/SpoVT family DNA-binding domain-containing protein [Cohnella soli]|uniref:AbrB/MazE/SpoVT family DNA-binding domain-containing protein n=1 Tax=Cohnella soli TaxID=425005 RepID=A0ABW0HMB5_9BACL
MQNTGIVRKVDELGRIVFPIELRRVLGIGVGDPLEIYVDEKYIMLKTYRGFSCLFCSDAGSSLVNFKGRLICNSCLDELRPPAPERPETIQSGDGSAPRKRREKQSAMLERLQQLMVQHPNAKQRALGEMLGVTTGRVSQLYKELKERTI